MTRELLVVSAFFAIASLPAHPAMMFGSSPTGTQSLNVATSDGLFSISAFDTGWYRMNGSQNPNSKNYASCSVGESLCTGDSTVSYNDFFAFRLGPITGTFQSATLSVGNSASGYAGPVGGATMRLWDYTGPVDALLNGSGGAAAVGDLGGGVIYASRLVSSADNATQVIFNLNADALADIEAALNSNNGPGVFVIGGSLTESAIPEPGTVALLGVGLAGIIFIRPRRG